MNVRDIDVSKITDAVRQLCLDATTRLNDDMIKALESSYAKEESPTGQDILAQILENAKIAGAESLSLCQDAGMAVVFVELGQDVHLSGGDLSEAINDGVRQGYRDGYLRPSTLDPLTRKPFEDNTPAIIHLGVVPGQNVTLHVLTKGFGGENQSRVELFPPAVGIEGVKRFVLETVEKAGANACPPVIVGVGIGGNLEMSALIAKKSLLRPIGQRHSDLMIARLEEALLEAINRTGIGPQGLGGRITALDVHIETHPTHIGSLPVAVNLQCHSHRHKTVTI
jgi:fumarate hydratase subunit alpha